MNGGIFNCSCQELLNFCPKWPVFNAFCKAEIQVLWRSLTSLAFASRCLHMSLCACKQLLVVVASFCFKRMVGQLSYYFDFRCKKVLTRSTTSLGEFTLPMFTNATIIHEF